jgi:hypothetical protein
MKTLENSNKLVTSPGIYRQVEKPLTVIKVRDKVVEVDL